MLCLFQVWGKVIHPWLNIKNIIETMSPRGNGVQWNGSVWQKYSQCLTPSMFSVFRVFRTLNSNIGVPTVYSNGPKLTPWKWSLEKTKKKKEKKAQSQQKVKSENIESNRARPLCLLRRNVPAATESYLSDFRSLHRSSSQGNALNPSSSSSHYFHLWYLHFTYFSSFLCFCVSSSDLLFSSTRSSSLIL